MNKNTEKFRKLASIFVKKRLLYCEGENTNEYNTNYHGSRNRLQIWRRN